MSLDRVSTRADVIGADQLTTRLDVLYGYAWLRPEWAVAIGDAV